jgi:histone H1/5
MAKAQGKKAAGARSGGSRKAAAKKQSSVGKTAGKKPVAKAAGKKQVGRKPSAKAAVKKTTRPAKAVARKAPARKTPAVKKPVAAKGKAKPAPKGARAKVRSGSGAVKKAARKAVAKVAKPVKAAVRAVKKAAPRAAESPKGAIRKAGRAIAAAAPVVAEGAARAAGKIAPAVAAVTGRAPEKKRGRRARTRIHSDGAPAAAWLTTEKPRPASFIPAPPRAEAPSAIAAAPASSDRLIRPEDLEQLHVRTVPVRVDIEQGAGRFYVIASPTDISVRAGEGIEWDFRYIGGADVSVEEMVIELGKPSPFAHATFRTVKPGGARPHRQISDPALPGAVGRRFEYTIRAMTGFKTEVASSKAWITVTG